MHSKSKKFLGLAVLLLVLGGCKDHDGEKFLGHWDAVDKDAKDFIDVKADGDIYHFDHSYRTVALQGIAYNVERFEGKPISGDVLRVGGGMPTYDVRLEKDILYFRGSGYTKSK